MNADFLATKLTTTLGCKHPVIQTAMGWIASARLVTASIRAGAFGFLAAAVMQPEECEAAIKAIKEESDQPFGVNLHAFQPGVERIVDICIAHEVAALSYGRAPSDKIIGRAKRHGLLCVPTLGAAKHVAKALALGADVLVCQGSEGGGHTGATPSWLLLAQTLDLDPGVPVVACGGFKDGRGLAAALTFGADGIAMGTRFLLTAESPVPANTKQAYLDAEVTRIPVSTKLDGLPQRMLLNKRLAQLESASSFGMMMTALVNGYKFRKHTGASLAGLLASAWQMVRASDLSLAQAMMAANAPMMIQESMVHGRPEKGILPSGQVAGLIDDLPSCDALVQQLVAEARMRLGKSLTATGGAQHAI